jgi:hypothetical protein
MFVNGLWACANRTTRLFHLMDLRQYSEFGQAHGHCGRYSR